MISIYLSLIRCIFQFIFELISGEFLPDNGILEVIMSFLAEYFCGPDDLLQGLCKSVIFFLCGFDDEQFPDELLPTIMQHTPAGSSVRQVSQYAQVRSHNICYIRLCLAMIR